MNNAFKTINLKRFFFILIFLFTGLNLMAQKKDKDLVIEKIDGKKYYIHSVEKGNTLYSISKKYGVDIEEIKKSNPEIANGLRIGQTIKIPVSKTDPKEKENVPALIEGDYLIHDVAEKETLYSIARKYNIRVKEIMDINPETVTDELSIGQKLKIPILKSQEVKPKDIAPATADSLITHIAKKGETVFSISRVYNISVDSIYMINPGLKKELKENQVIRIPRINPAVQFSVPADTITKPAIILKDAYNLALMLPLHTSANDSIERNLKFNERPFIHEDSKIALLFYEGAMLALDSLKKSGLSANVFIFDTGHDSLTVSALMQNPQMKNMDLFIGPFHQNLFKDVALYAKQNQIGIVCPVPQSAKILLENKYASKVLASPLVQTDQLANYIIENFSEKKILVFAGNDKTDQRLSQAFVQKAEDLLEKQGRALSSVVNSYSFADINIEKLKALLSPDTNIIVVPSYNHAFTSDLFTKLNSLSEVYNFSVFALDKITEYEDIDVQYLHKLNVHVASPFHIDYEDPKTIQFNDEFRTKYKTEPGEFGFLGFNISYYYLSALMKYGENFYEYLPEFKMQLLSNGFDFMKTGFDSGYENKHVYILKYEDFKLKRVK